MNALGSPPASVGPYRLEKRLGGGGMGEVFRGFDERLGRAVALKQIRAMDTRDSEEIRERFRREARAVARLDHPAIVQVHDWVETDDGDWLVMELVEGRTLRDAIDEDGPFGPDRAIVIAIAITSALAAAHEGGILHRDLKAENVMLTPDGGVKLLDFGLAKRVGTSHEAEPSLTADGKILGTVSAMSPEQAIGDPLDGRSDLFALGSLLYRLTSGRSPFSEASPLATLRAIVADRHRPLRSVAPAVPAALSRLVDQLLQKDPDQRPRDANVTLGLLRELATASTARARVPRLGLSQRRERRPVTVVAVGPATGRDTADPEELLDRVPWIDALVSACAERWGGRLEGRMGPHWVICFGVPIAREDDARRAVHAALELIDQAVEADHALAAGIHSGTAVVTVADQREELALGPTFDVAGELQARAPAFGVLTSDANRALTSRFFRWADAGQLDTAGKQRAIFRVKAPDDAGDMLDLSTPLIGRSRELEHLLEAWRSAVAGSGRVVRLTGEPGVGKSRLLGQLRVQLAEGSDPDWLQLNGSTIGRSSPFQPVIHLLMQTLGLRPDDDDARRTSAITHHVRELGLPIDDVVPHLALLLGVDRSSYSMTANLDPGVRKRRLQEAIATLWLEQAEIRPMVMVVEDLQWMDPSTIELLTLVIEQAPTVSLLVLASHRLDHRPPWDGHGHVTEVRLERLSPEAVERLATEVAGAPLPPDVVTRIADKADGVPLFAEELTRAVIESGQLVERDGRFVLRRPVAELVVPATLNESLTARLDRLGSARPVAQRAAVVGRSFPRQHLISISDTGAADVDHALDRLVEADLLLRRGFGQRARFVFRHALIQDAAYHSLLRRQRRQLHARLAETLEREGGSPPELMAHHLTQAGLGQRAIPFWKEAGEAAFLASANREAVDHFRQALHVLDTVPEGRERNLLEMDLLTRIGRSLSGVEGYSSPAVLAVYERADALATEFDDEPRVAEVAWGLWAFHIVRSDIPAALTRARQMMRHTERSDDPTARVVAQSSVGNAWYFAGDLQQAKTHSEAAIEEHDAWPDRHIETPNPQDLGVLAPLILALTSWHLGDGEGAIRSLDEAIDLADELEHSYSQVLAASYGARLHQSRRDAEATRELADEVVRLSEERGFFWITQGWFFTGCALAQETMDTARETGDEVDMAALDEAVESMLRGLGAYRRTGAGLSVSYMSAQLVEAHLWRRDIDAAQHHLAEARSAAGEGKEGFWRPELDRLAGEIAHQNGEPEIAETWARKALESATAAGDHALSLRAALSLAQWAIAEQRNDAAADLLATALGPFDAFAEDGDQALARRLLAELL